MLWALAGLTLLFMLTGSFANAIFKPSLAGVVPGPFILMSFLKPFYV